MPIQREHQPLDSYATTWYTPDQIADMLQISKFSIYRAIKAGKLPAYQIDSIYRITDNDLSHWIKPYRRANRWAG